jgi:hypothetical protein
MTTRDTDPLLGTTNDASRAFPDVDAGRSLAGDNVGTQDADAP